MTKLQHGSYGVWSHFDIEQLAYGANEVGYTESLHIKDAPLGRAQFVVVRASDTHRGFRYRFWEFQNAVTAKGLTFAWSDSDLRAAASRFVDCGERPPWFYAESLELVDGDFVRSFE